ncbi:MAG: hypothetical protein KGL19_09160 [Bacteroidota bacterium]|nr:hypothetical protein [Bacteroidota bacterium]
MKKIAIISLLFLPFYWVNAQNLSPYIVGFETNETVINTQEKVVNQLEINGIKVVGKYQPANDKNRAIIIFTSAELETAIKKIGGLTGFAATLRIGITNENGKTIVSYTNPQYWGNAYFRNDFDKVASNYTALTERLEKTMKASGEFIGKPFGSKHGLSVKDLRKYHYMFSMPYFDDAVELANFDNYTAALDKIEAGIKKGVPDVKMIYKVTIPGKELTLYGFALSGEKGENKFLPIIDISQPKHTAFLPYEVLVSGNKVLMLHGRYRIALSFPDLTMMTFTKIMSTPGNIENLLKQLVK